MLKSHLLTLGRYVAYFAFICLAICVGNGIYDTWNDTNISWGFAKTDSQLNYIRDSIPRFYEATRIDAYDNRQELQSRLASVKDDLQHLQETNATEFRDQLIALRAEIRALATSRTAASWTVTVTPKPVPALSGDVAVSE